MQEIKITRAQTLKEKPESSTLVFGKSMTDHMFIVDYDAGQGWHDPRIVPYAPLQIDPAAKVLHYAQEIFEGLKAYRTDDGSIQLFRPMDNIRRMNDSAERISLPQIPEELARLREAPLPAVVPIPGISGNTGLGLRQVKRSVEQAVGSDILANES